MARYGAKMKKEQTVRLFTSLGGCLPVKKPWGKIYGASSLSLLAKEKTVKLFGFTVLS